MSTKSVGIFLEEELKRIISLHNPGEKIPGERVLAVKLNVARMTLRHAIENLIVQGIIERRPGSGTYVSNNCFSLSAKCRSFSAEIKSQGMIPKNVILWKKTSSADLIVSKKLRIPIGSKVLKFSRLRFGDQIAMAVQSVTIPLAYLRSECNFYLEGSLEDELRAQHGISISGSQTEISVGKPDLRISSLLELVVGADCLIKESIDSDEKLRTVMHSKTWYHPDRFKIRFSTSCDENENPLVSFG